LDLESEIGRLYGLPPEEFIAARDQLRRRRREEGDREGAERVRGLRRPTVAAWAVNQVARERPELVQALQAAGDRLRQAQRRAVSGLRDSGLRAAAAERRTLLEQLLKVASGVLEQAGRPAEPHRDAIAATFEAASVDAEAAAAVRGGTLGHELAAPSGFGDVGGLELVPAMPPASEPESRRGRPAGSSRRGRELEAVRRHIEDLRRQAGESVSAAAEARQAADRADEEADVADEEADRLAREARDAQRALEEARRAAEQANREAKAARERAQRLVRRSRSAAERARNAEAGAWSLREALEEAGRRIAELEESEE
jgi:DNA repair exonuclease SbcCD ATPase subunit